MESPIEKYSSKFGAILCVILVIASFFGGSMYNTLHPSSPSNIAEKEATIELLHKQIEDLKKIIDENNKRIEEYNGLIKEMNNVLNNKQYDKYNVSVVDIENRLDAISRTLNKGSSPVVAPVSSDVQARKLSVLTDQICDYTGASREAVLEHLGELLHETNAKANPNSNFNANANVNDSGSVSENTNETATPADSSSSCDATPIKAEASA